MAKKNKKGKKQGSVSSQLPLPEPLPSTPCEDKRDEDKSDVDKKGDDRNDEENAAWLDDAVRSEPVNREKYREVSIS